jgi:tetratricopeptide (TPR) repeat protein
LQVFRFWKIMVLAGAAITASGCATTAHQTEALLVSAPSDIPRAFEIPNVDFIEQSENYCGPATLAMAMKHAGQPRGVEELAAQVYTPGKKGTLQQDMMSASRRQGMLAVPIQGMQALLQEIAAGHPVIVLENLAFTWYPKWHYALVYGYDLDEPEVILHSGSSKAKHWSMRKFERNWIYGDFWGLVVLPPDQMAVSGDELGHAAAAAGLEQVGQLGPASQVYQNILKRWPHSLGALIGMGNLSYTKSDFKGAVGYLREATLNHPLSAPAWHNLAVAEGAAGMKKAARKSAAKALELATPDALAAYQESLKDLI